MQFITNGPDIPDALLQAHEEGRVVFFCGAGISYPAGLPGFKGLVEQIYKLNGTELKEIEQEAFDRNQFDATLDLLERRLPGQRLAVRRALAQALKPKLRRKGATDTQAALLRLARSRRGALRLITTNFDRVFHSAAKRTNQEFHAYTAPMLPIPKNSRWDGLVYLHGLIPGKADDTTLNRLVVTSGDFGLAYLTERWAARFVSELFRNYIVCFVGYSINDPVLRYMMDALAADRMLGEVTPQAWALGDCESGQEHRKAIEWEAKGVTPILYEVPAGIDDHSALHKTLHKWAEIYRDGVLGKEQLVVNHALARPSATTQQDDFVGRMLWALSDKSGLPAKRFADFNPVPSLEWLLDAFSDDRFRQCDLTRFRVHPHEEGDVELQFSLIQRPAPYDRAPPMMLVCNGIGDSSWDDVMFHLARWLLRHLDDPSLIIWIAQRGGKLHNQLLRMIASELDRFASLERDSMIAELDEIRSQAPKAVPGPTMRILWGLLLNGQVKSSKNNPGIYLWLDRLKREGLTFTLRLELRNLLAPRITLKKPFRWGNESEDADEPIQIKQIVGWELELAADHVHLAIQGLTDAQWQAALPLLLDDFQQLLRDALDMMCELGEADDSRDRSHLDLPSITPHPQNRGFRDWVTLIELLREAWLMVLRHDGPRATQIAQAWFELPYPAFKRLALFAASCDTCIPTEQWVDWLLVNGARWLWSANTLREVFRLLVLQGKSLEGESLARLEVGILAGPPCGNGLDSSQRQDFVARCVWLHLAKLSSSGVKLGDTANERLGELSKLHSSWKLADNERDEFSYWMSSTGDPDFEASQKIDIAPRTRQQLVQWLTKPQPEERAFHSDTWREVCRSRLFHSLFALCDLATGGDWPLMRWRAALHAWSEDDLAVRSWRYAAPLVQKMPDSVFEKIADSAAWWIKSASKSINYHEDILLDLAHRVLTLPLEPSTGIFCNGGPLEEPVTEAINHPVGIVTQALINLWFKRCPNDNDGLPHEIASVFTKLCDEQIDRFRHGRVLLCSQLIALFRADRSWTKQYLLPLFSWENSVEAKGVWEGFLWSPRLYQPLLTAFKDQFLETAKHYEELGESRTQFAALLTYAALGPIDDYTVSDFRKAFAELPTDGLEHSARSLSQALEGTADQREEYWKNRVQPFWKEIWPKSRDLASTRIAESLAQLIIAAGREFPTALTAVESWLKPLEHLHHTMRNLHESGIYRKYPNETIRLLNIVIDDQPYPPKVIGEILDEIGLAAPELENDSRYNRLRDYVRRRGI